MPLQNGDPITQDMNFRSSVLGFRFDTHWNYRKIEHENGLKVGPQFQRYILMQIIREFNHKLIEVSHI